MVPLLFSLCSCAQGAAAAQALAGAGANVDGAAKATDVVLETVQEYFWRLLIDWPRTMRHGIDAASVADVRRKIAARGNGRDPKRGDESRDADARACRLARHGRRAEDLRHVAGGLAHPRRRRRLAGLGGRGATMPARLLGLLLDTMPDLGRSDVALMPFPAREALDADDRAGARRGNRSSRVRRRGAALPVETGALARMRSQPLVAALAARDGNSVATRMAARLAELATLLQALAAPGDEGPASWVQAFALAPGEGLGAVQTARGLLLHRASVAEGRVADYQIVAPTEWNFHPEGALVARSARCWSRTTAPCSSAGAARVQALDPCVACAIEVGHA